MLPGSILSHTHCDLQAKTRAASVSPCAEMDFPCAASDYPRAGTDFPRAASDYPRAGSDFPCAASNIPCAASVSPRAPTDYPHAASDYLRAASVYPRAATISGSVVPPSYKGLAAINPFVKQAILGAESQTDRPWFSLVSAACNFSGLRRRVFHLTTSRR